MSAPYHALNLNTSNVVHIGTSCTALYTAPAVQILAHDSTEMKGRITCTLEIPKSTFVKTEESYLHRGLGPYFNVGVAV